MADEKPKKVELYDLKPIDKKHELTLDELAGVSGGACCSKTLWRGGGSWHQDSDQKF